MRTSPVTAFAPASVGNVAVGFDILGHALAGMGDRVTVSAGSDPGVSMGTIDGTAANLPTEAERNTAGRAVMALIQDLGLVASIEVSIEKGIPLASGLGGSAASAVAAVVAANEFFQLNLEPRVLYPYALAGETVASGTAHGDNVAPQLLGGLVLVAGDHLIPIPIPDGLLAVAIHPHCQVETAEARQLLSAPFELGAVVQQSARLGLLLAGCYRNDSNLLSDALIDTMIEPRRAALIPGFDDVQRAALSAGAMGATISGAGPTVCAWASSTAQAVTIADAMQAAFLQHGLASDRLICAVDSPGAQIVSSA
ncbi:MAG: homoserine kinase [Pseudomonadota bacterium]